MLRERMKRALGKGRQEPTGPRWLVVNEGPNRAQRRAEQAQARRENRQARREIDREIGYPAHPGAPIPRRGGKLPGRKPPRSA